mmetsp:Transcript_23681/g.51791  ORF Transcript_23681/g.51791 Transcript_23681/m.51791 type:complete len:121 (-) Transcript_23681:94-456(-)
MPTLEVASLHEVAIFLGSNMERRCFDMPHAETQNLYLNCDSSRLKTSNWQDHTSRNLRLGIAIASSTPTPRDPRLQQRGAPNNGQTRRKQMQSAKNISTSSGRYSKPSPCTCNGNGKGSV